MYLCGFLSPEGCYTPCDSFCHMSVASELVEKCYNLTLGGIKAEDYLFEHGYLIFYSRNAYHRFRSDSDIYKLNLLTDLQKNFLIQNLCNTNNDSQKKDIEKILQYDSDYREDSILTIMEDKFIS